MRGKKCNLCIVDDDDLYLTILKKIILHYELCEEIMVFKNGQEAVDFFKSVEDGEDERLPDVIFLDLDMPVLDGWGFLDEYPQFERVLKDTDIYISSSSKYSVDINRAKSYPFISDYLVKPLDQTILKRVLQRA